MKKKKKKKDQSSPCASSAPEENSSSQKIPNLFTPWLQQRSYSSLLKKEKQKTNIKRVSKNCSLHEFPHGKMVGKKDNAEKATGQKFTEA